MLLSWKWLKEYIDLGDLTAQELAKKMTLSGIEVERIFTLSNATNLVVGEVLERVKHPEADKLSICQVNLGTSVEQIICGAPNVAAGQKVVVARIGATLPDGLKIKKAKLRGVESNGMICSLKELGIENKLIPQEFQSGIVVLDKNAPVGMDALSYLGYNEPILELSLTPNRSDCLSLYGLIYEIGAILNKPVKLAESELSYKTDSDFSVKITSPDCSLYYAKKVRNVKIKRSPDWLQSALIACGVRPINNVVDITNFVMMELGQPLHAFDLNKLAAQEIVVRNAVNGEKIITLDGVERDLWETDLLITDGVRPIALAGVMGGQNTEIDEHTTDVLLESAVFRPLAVRNTYTRLGLRSESSIRFEKQVDPERTLLALNRAALLLVKLADGKIDDKLSVASTVAKTKKVVNLPLKKVNDVLGLELSEKVVQEALERLQFNYTYKGGVFAVEVPTRRPDISIQEDLIEEIIRIYGYEHLNLTLPSMSSNGVLTRKQRQIRLIRKVLLATGLSEVMTYSLVNPKNNEHFLTRSLKEIRLRHPMSEDRSVMRQGLIPSLLEVVNYNQARKREDVAIFEIGSRYYYDNDAPKEELLLSGAVSGRIVENEWQNAFTPVDFYFVKGALENVFERLAVLDKISFVPATNPPLDFHPGKTAEVFYDGTCLGLVGAVHPNTLKTLDISETYVFELNLDLLLEIEVQELTFSPLSKYPTMSRDMALIVDKTLSAQNLIDVITREGKAIMKQVEVFDVYQGENIEKTKKSIALSLTFENKERTLTDDEVNKVYDRIVRALELEFQAILRK